MPRTTIVRLIIKSPFAEPQRHWRFERATRPFDLVHERSIESLKVLALA